MKILLIEDDQSTREYIADGLTREGHTVDRASNGRDGLFLASDGSYDLLVVDRRLPGLDGLSVVKALRGLGCTAPVLFLTALDGIDERVAGLNAGADDYLVKPLVFSELSARVAALLRRPALRPQEKENELKVGDLALNLLSRKVSRRGQAIDLQPREFLLLEYLMRHCGQVVTRTSCWRTSGTTIRSQDVCGRNASAARAKIDKPFDGNDQDHPGYRLYRRCRWPTSVAPPARSRYSAPGFGGTSYRDGRLPVRRSHDLDDRKKRHPGATPAGCAEDRSSATCRR
jgi:two-component system OmpR family response regulator